MKAHRVIPMMVLVSIWMASLSMAMGRADQAGAEGVPQKEVKADERTKKTRNGETAAAGDAEIAERLEMLQFMEMLEHFDLIRDLDVLEGGGE